MSDVRYIRGAMPGVVLGSHALLQESSGNARLIPEIEAEILASWRRFRTLGEQVQHLRDRGFQEEAEGELARACENLRDRGLLISERELGEKARKSGLSSSAEPGGSGALVWPTRNRPDAVSRSVQSFVTNARAHGHGPEYWVFDQSDSLQSDRTQTSLARVAREAGIAVRYVGPREQQRFVQQLADRLGMNGEDRRVLRFALGSIGPGGAKYGANRNAALLATCGKRVLMNDDDALAPDPGCQSNDHSPGRTLRLSSATHAALFRAFSPGEHITGKPPGADVIGLCRATVGSKSEQLKSSLDSAAVKDVGPDLAAMWSAGTGHIVGAHGGWRGAPINPSRDWQLIVTGDARQNINATDEEYGLAREADRFEHSVDSLVVTDRKEFVTVSAALDNTLTLPPFLPIGRSSDALFTHSCAALWHDVLWAFLPYVVEHQPPERRTIRRFSSHEVGLGMADCVRLLIDHVSFRPEPRFDARALRRLGTELMTICSIGDAAFADLLHFLGTRHFANFAEYLDGLLAVYHGQPASWARDVEHKIEVIEKTVFSEGRVPLIGGVFDSASTWNTKVHVVGTTCRSFGRLFQLWGSIRDAAATCRGDDAIPHVRIAG